MQFSFEKLSYVRPAGVCLVYDLLTGGIEYRPSSVQRFLLDLARLVPYNAANGRQAIAIVGMVLPLCCNVRCRSLLLQSGLYSWRKAVSCSCFPLLRFGPFGVDVCAVRDRRVASGGVSRAVSGQVHFVTTSFAFQLISQFGERGRNANWRLDDEIGRTDLHHFPVTEVIGGFDGW